MEMVIDFPGGSRVDAHFGPYTVSTDQPPMGGGDGSAPTPFAVFLSSIGTCAGIYIHSFCQQRDIPVHNVKLTQKMERNKETGKITKITLEIQLPADFPEKYKGAVAKAAGMCSVKKQLSEGIVFDTVTTTSS